MRPTDLIGTSLKALWQQKLRTALTLIGVVVGTSTLVVSLSVGGGVREALEKEFRKQEELRTIQVWPSYEGADPEAGVPAPVLKVRGKMSPAKRERIRKMLAQRWKRRNAVRPAKGLTPERLNELAALPHVAAVVPTVDGNGRATFNGRSADALFTALPADVPRLAKRLEAGSPFTSDTSREVLVHEFLLYEWGVTDDAAVAAVVGKTFELEMSSSFRSPMSLLRLLEADTSNLSVEELRVVEKVWRQFPSAVEHIDLTPRERELFLRLTQRRTPRGTKPKEFEIRETFRIAGVVRAATPEEARNDPIRRVFGGDSDLILPLRTGEAVVLQIPRLAEEGFFRAEVLVDRDENVKEVSERIKKLGFNEFSLGVVVDQVRRNVRLINFALNFVALIALLVAALGIMNTLFTSVLERRREIGIMKAVGAKDRHVQLIFLIEGALIGLAGGAGGVLVGWLLSLPGDSYARRLMAEQTQQPPPETLFLFPLWLVFGVPLFAGLVTTLAALYPARRAARVDPIVALRHE